MVYNKDMHFLPARRTLTLAGALIAASFVAAIAFYPLLPEQVPSHWNAAGEVNGYLPRGWGAFLMPVLAIAILALLIVIPRIDPKRENIVKFRLYLDDFILALLVFLAYIHLLTMFAALGSPLAIGRWMAPGIALLFWVAGTLVAHAEPNWTAGIRTPWTLSSETVWRKTHILGGKLFRASAVIALLGAILPGTVAFWFILAPALATAALTVVYSYVVYRREQRVNGK